MVLPVIAIPPVWAPPVQRIFSAYERARYKSYGRLTTAFGRVLLLPIAFIEPSSKMEDNELRIGIPEGLTFMGYKLLAEIDRAIEGKFDFLVHTNSSSFLNIKGLHAFLETVDPNLDFYGGKELPVPLLNGVSGSFVILSKKSLSRIWKSRRSWIHALLDDVALAKIMQDLGILRTLIPSLDSKSLKYILGISQIELEQTYHFKCGPVFENGLRSDDQNMKSLWKRYTEEP
jgi:hypothetical protein